MKHVISIWVEDKYGALARVTELFSSRGYNLESVCTGECKEKGTHRMTLVCTADDHVIQQIIKQLQQIVFVVDVQDLPYEKRITRELLLMNISVNDKNRSEILSLIKAYPTEIVQMNSDHIIFQAIGNADQLDGLAEVFRKFKILQLARTGEAAIQS